MIADKQHVATDQVEEYSDRLSRILELRRAYLDNGCLERTLDGVCGGRAAEGRLQALVLFVWSTLGLKVDHPTDDAIKNCLQRLPALRVVLLELFDTWPFCLELAACALKDRPKLLRFLEIERCVREFDEPALKDPANKESLTDRLATLFFLREDLAQEVASTLLLPVPFQMVFRRELECVAASRGLRIGRHRALEGHSCWEQAKKAQLFGVALSGGGIRSATFSLGVIQGLAEVRMGPGKEPKLLHLVDYLSSVSGGGYIASWLHSWIMRSDEQAAGDLAGNGLRDNGLDRVIANLSQTGCPDPEAEPQAPIKFLRRYSKYLTPESGFLSADTWTVISIWLRNTSLNLLILALGLSALLLLPRIFPIAVFISNNEFAAWYAVPLLFLALVLAGLNLGSFTDRERRQDSFWYQQKGVHLLLVVPILLAGMILSSWYLWLTANAPYNFLVHARVGVVCGLLTLLISIAGRYYECWYDDYGDRNVQEELQSRLRKWLGLLLCSLVTGGVAVGLSFLLEALFSIFSPFGPWLQLTLGPPLVMGFLFAVIVCHIGLLGRNLPDDRREWWGRAGAYLILYAFAWPLLCAIALWSPAAIAWSFGRHWGWPTSAALVWIASTASGVLAGKSKATGDQRSQDSVVVRAALEAIAAVTPYIFIAGLLIVLSCGIQALTLRLRHPWIGSCGDRAVVTAVPASKLRAGARPFSVSCGSQDGRKTAPQHPAVWTMPAWKLLSSYPENYLSIVSWYESLAAASSCLLLAFILAWRVNVNEFSMHHYYKNRLVRCYLGASQRRRRPNRFTGIDPDDDRCLGDFTAKADSPIEGLPRGGPVRIAYSGPYPIVNATLNLTHGDELAWQDRKAQSFMFTPEFCGYATTPTQEIGTGPAEAADIATYGFRPTRLYAYPDAGIHLGSAMAISGAAASPNEGYNTSPANAFLMTVFNVRLGWWISNTRDRKRWKSATPAWGLFYLLRELLGATNNKSSYLYLSDGGHFENLGLYELVHRRCAFIICCDASQDPNLTFEDLGGAIRKCRTDYGAEIKIGLDSLKRDATTGLSKAHCVVGTITYNDNSRGTLVYIKPTLTGSEPADVAEYRAAHPEFPHDSTLNQFFTEAQFESYRALGYQTIRSVFEPGRFDVKDGLGVDAERDQTANPAPPSIQGPWQFDPLYLNLRKLFEDLALRWYPSNETNEKSFTRLAATFDELTERMRKDAKLARLSSEFYPELGELKSGSRVFFREEFYYCLNLIQLMEDVFLDLRLHENFDHPDNQGWINTFHRWTGSPTFQRTWLINSGLFGSRFRMFMASRFQLTTGSLRIGQLRTKAGLLQKANIELKAANAALSVVVGSVWIADENTVVWIEISKPFRRLGWATKALETVQNTPDMRLNLDPQARTQLENDPQISKSQDRYDPAAAEGLKRKMQTRTPSPTDAGT